MKSRIAVAIATWFYSGLLPAVRLPGVPKEMAGTYGSLAALPLCWAAAFIDWYYLPNGSALAAAIALTFALGMWSVPLAEETLGPRRDWKGRIRTRDQNQIVIDEVLGMLVASAPITSPRHALILFLAAFGLFRLFDIVKPWPIKFFDRKKSAFGVMWDDVIAGCYAAFGVKLLTLL